MTFEQTLSLPLTALAELFGQAFEDYLVPISSDPVALAARIRQEQIDLAASLVVRAPNGELAGIALIARRGDTSRLAGMGITAPWRGQKAGQALVSRVVQEASERQDRRMVLEVIEQNTPAVRLYEKSGFVALRRLVGHEAPQWPRYLRPWKKRALQNTPPPWPDMVNRTCPGS